jgi:putative transposase
LTIRRILKAAGLPPAPHRPTSWQTFLKAHWGVIAGADFLTTEVWTWRGLVTHYTVLVIDLAARRVHVLGSTPHPSELFMGQVVRMMTAADDGGLGGHRVVICDRDRKWSRAVPCLDRVIPLGERHVRRVITEFVAHDHLERNHQGLNNRLIMGMPSTDTVGRVRRRSRLGGLLNYYERAA